MDTKTNQKYSSDKYGTYNKMISFGGNISYLKEKTWLFW